MTAQNKHVWQSFFQEAKEYILGLTNLEDKKLVVTPKKTGFLGFLVAMRSVEGIFTHWVEPANSHLKYLLTYNFTSSAKIMWSYSSEQSGPVEGKTTTPLLSSSQQLTNVSFYTACRVAVRATA